MNTGNPAVNYQQAAARGTTPVGQVVALYDTILRDLARALAALQTGRTETRVDELNHALLVIAHLQNVLDHERGGDAARRFEQFYNATRGLIVQANAEASADSLRELIDIYSSLRQAWYQVETDSTTQQTGGELHAMPQETAVDSSTPEPASSNDETIRLQWSA
jgi:flagellar secretion chaperone FliS